MKRLVYLLILIPGITWSQNTKVIAHRGGASLAPENTLAAFNKAVEVNADYYELDVQISKDDSLIIMHDATVDRTTDGTGAIVSMTFEQLRSLDAGSWFGPEFTGEKVPSFREALAVAINAGTNIGVVVELKSSETVLAGKVVEVITEMGLQDRVIISSFSLSQITQVKTLDPTIAVQLFASVTTSHIDQIAAINGEWVGSSGPFNQTIIDYAHSLGIKFNVWTINSASQMIPLFALGVDAITTDNPVVMIESMDSTEPTDVVLLSASVIENEVFLEWEEALDPESGISGYSIFRDVNPGSTTFLTNVGPVTQYTDRSTAESQQYYYRIKAINKSGLSSLYYSNEISVTTLNDVTEPFVEYVTSKGDNTSVTIEFSENISKPDAENKNNYTVNNEVIILEARLARDQKSVILTTSSLAERSYVLTIQNLQDIAMIPNTISPVNIVFEYKAFSEGFVAFYNLDTIVLSDTDFLALDASVNLNHGIVKNGALITSGQLGNALGFDGIDDYIQFSASPSFNIGTNSVSVSLWTKMDFLPTELPSTFGPLFDSETDQYVLYEDKGNSELRFKVTTSSGAERPGIPDADLVSGEWIHIVGVYDGTNAMIYLNGILKDTHPLTGTVNPGQNATLGKSGTSYFSGSIDQLEVYNRALTVEEITEKYNLKTVPLAIYPVSVEIPGIQTDFSIYPNPNNGQFTIDLNSISNQKAMVEVFNSLGKVIYKDDLNTRGKMILQIPSAPAGLYIVRILTGAEIFKQNMIIN